MQKSYFHPLLSKTRKLTKDCDSQLLEESEDECQVTKSDILDRNGDGRIDEISEVWALSLGMAVSHVTFLRPKIDG